MHGRRDTVGGENDGLALGHLGLLVHEHGSPRLEIADDMQVVDDLLAHVDGWPVQVERLLHRLDGAFDSGAIAAGRGEQDLPHHGASVPRWKKERPAARGVVAADLDRSLTTAHGQERAAADRIAQLQ